MASASVLASEPGFAESAMCTFRRAIHLHDARPDTVVPPAASATIYIGAGHQTSFVPVRMNLPPGYGQLSAPC